MPIHYNIETNGLFLEEWQKKEETQKEKEETQNEKEKSSKN